MMSQTEEHTHSEAKEEWYDVYKCLQLYKNQERIKEINLCKFQLISLGY